METRSTCPYCGVGCGVLIQHDGARITGVRGDPEHPANFGKLCIKGTTLHETTRLTGRALYPELRAGRATARGRVSWDTALDHAADRFAAIIREHGPDAVGFYVSGQLLTEDYYVFNKLARALVGTNNIDSNSRLCMSSAVAGYKATLGSDAVPCSYEDIALADLFFIAGSNTAFAHPVLFRRIEEARAKRPEAKLIVVDPRRTDTAAMADLHLAIAPGSDVILYSAMVHVMLWENLVDHAFIAEHTAGFADLREQVAEITPAAAAQVCGVKAEAIVAAARMFGNAAAPLSLYCQGLNQSAHGTANNAAIIHLHLATGTIGKPGMGPFSLTGQPNAMGGREVGAMANLLPGHRNPACAEDRAELAAAWGVPSIPERPGTTAVEMFEAVRTGAIKALWIACTNPAHSLPDQPRVREALAAAEFVVVQDAYADIETADYADLLLPAATWGEKDGTVTNSERRITRVRAALSPPGEARADWAIAADFARRLATRLQAAGAAVPPGLTFGAGGTTPRPPGLTFAADGTTPRPPGLTFGAGGTTPPLPGPTFEFADVAAVYAEHVATTVGRDLDIGGLSHAVLESGPRQWPLRAGEQEGAARLYTDFKFAFPDGRARFSRLDLRLTAEATDARHPLHLTTGRLRDQWHGMSRTGRAPRLHAHEPAARLQLHPADMARRGVAEGDLLRIKSRRGEIVLPVAASDELKPGNGFIAMHWGGRSLSHAGVNELTLSVVDPVSRQPELKHAAIRVEAAALPWRLVLLRAAEAEGADGEEQLLRWRERLARLLARFGYAALTLAGREHPLLALEIAHGAALDGAALAEFEAAVDFGDALKYADAARGIVKRARVDADGRLTGMLLAGETAAAPWLKQAMLAASPLGELRRWMFAPRAQPPVAMARAGRTVCNCLGVSDEQISAMLATGVDLAGIQRELKCGTSCGSCLPELRRMAGASRRAETPAAPAADVPALAEVRSH